MKCFAIVSYSGEAYYGFQRQPKHVTVQGVIEKQLGFLLGAPTVIKAAGRTDTGVHALGQTFTFECSPLEDINATKTALNKLLPEDIFIRELKEVPESFDARFSAVGKIYRYVFTINERDPLRSRKIAQLRRDDFKFDAFLQGLRCFEGEHNFQNFTTKPEDSHGFVRRIDSIEATLGEDGNLVTVFFKGDGFMRYQIRMMIGSAIRCGLNKLAPKDIQSALESSVRLIVPYKAPAEGLCLMEVLYEE